MQASTPWRQHTLKTHLQRYQCQYSVCRLAIRRSDLRLASVRCTPRQWPRSSQACNAVDRESEVSVSEAAQNEAPAAASTPSDQDLGDLLEEKSAIEAFAALLVLTSPFFFWGTSMVAMKALSAHTTPLFVSWVRMLPAGLILTGWAVLQKRPQPKGLTAWLWILAFGFADATCFQGFLAEGLQRTSAGLGSIIIDSQPLTVALMASILFKERLTFLGYCGLGVGILGLCLLEVRPEQVQQLAAHGLQFGQHDQAWSLWDSGEWWMLLAAQSMAVGTVLMRYVSKYADPVMATGYHMLLGGIPLLLLSVNQESGLLAERLPLLSGTDFALLTYISVLGSAASYGVFFLNASRGNLTALSSLTFLTPLFAAVAGYFFLGEVLTTQQLIGAAITLSGVYFINTPNQ